MEVPSYRIHRMFLLLSMTLSLGVNQFCQSVEILSTSAIAFGSCNRQNKPQDHWEAIRATNPDLFLWTGVTIFST